MTARQRRFCDEYLTDCNIARAYKAAYPRVKSVVVASTNGGRLLKNAELKAYLDEQLEKLHTSRVCDAREILEYLSSVLRGESEAEIVVTERTGEGRSEARTMTKHPDEKERLKAAELLARHYQLFVPKLEVSGEAGGGIVFLPEVTEGEP